MVLNHYCKSISSQEWKEHVNTGNTQESHLKWFPKISLSESLRQWFENLENPVHLWGTSSMINTSRKAEIRFQTVRQKPTKNSTRLICLVVAWPVPKRTSGDVSSHHFDRRDTLSHSQTFSKRFRLNFKAAKYKLASLHSSKNQITWSLGFPGEEISGLCWQC